MKHSFYRPHARVLELGQLVNPVTGEITTPPSMTKQEFVRECDINNIIKHFSQTGMLNHVSANAAMGAYQDLPDDLDFQNALHTVQQAETAFLSLPSKIRDRFGNDPVAFLAFASNPANLDELRELGIANPKPVAAVPATEPSPAKPEPPKT